MRGREMLDAIENLNPAYIEAAAETPKANKAGWLKWGAIAACLCLVIGGGIAVSKTGVLEEPPGSISTDREDFVAPAYGFYLEDDPAAVYYPISFLEAKEYGLVPEGALGVKDIFSITEDDIGDLMGTVTGCEYEELNGCNVYHFAKYPENDTICIADTPSGYKFYVCSWLSVENEIGASSDILLSAYELPGSMEKMQLFDSDFQHIADVEDDAVIEAIFEILSGKTNSGLEANERRFAQAWYDAYGNDNVFYSEAVGHCVYRETEFSDQAHALWQKDERIIRITTANGYRIDIDYFPSIRTFQFGDGYYDLSDIDAETLNQLLQITD